MKRKDIEDLIGEDMEDMGLVQQIEDRECEWCGHLIEDGNINSICNSCKIKHY